MSGDMASTFLVLVATVREGDWLAVLQGFFPFALLFELPLYLLVLTGILRYAIGQLWHPLARQGHPSVSCIITCYSEGEAVAGTILSLAEQRYGGDVEIIAVIDGAVANADTLRWARDCQARVAALPRRSLIVLPKWQRGGRVSSLNTGLALAHGEVAMALDGDTSFDNDMVEHATRHFDDRNVVAVAGALRVRNPGASLAARLQAIEYILSIMAGKTGLSEFNVVNNVSGAFGIFRADFLRNLGGWSTGSAEDLDLTLRIKQYFARYPHLRIVFDPQAVGLTDAPETFNAYFRQRLRWDGDLFYIFIRKFRFSLRPGLLGWPNFLAVTLAGVFVQVAMPFVIFAYVVYLFASLPSGQALGLLGFLYLVYLAALLLLYAVHLTLISERPREDLGLLPLILIFPLFALASRLWSAVAIALSAGLRTHLDSNMAPWWVLKRARF